MDMPAPAPKPPPSAAPPGGSPSAPPAALQQKAQAIAASIPLAEKPLPAASVQSVVDAFNDAKSALLPHIAGEMPMPQPDAGAAFTKLPAEVYVPIALMLEEMAQVAPGAEKYACDPTTLKNVAGVRALAGKLMALAKDKKIVAAVKDAIEAQTGGEEAEGPHEETGDEMTPQKAPLAMKYAQPRA